MIIKNHVNSHKVKLPIFYHHLQLETDSPVMMAAVPSTLFSLGTDPPQHTTGVGRLWRLIMCLL